jgi:opacity protein-like surface antigen
MKFTLKAGIALAALTSAAAMTGSAYAADLGGDRGGSMKDGGYSPMPEIVRGASGPCYVRADVGYSWADEPTLTWPVNNDNITGFFENNDSTKKFHETSRTSTFVTDKVANTSRDSHAFGEVGLGCGASLGMPGRGIRGEVMFGFHGNSKIDGEPGTYNRNVTVIDDPGVTPPPPTPGNPPPVDVVDPLHTNIESYTLMFNVYKDLGQFGRLTPYVGAGIGAAYHQVDETYFTGNYNLLNKIEGDESLSFAWSLMAGVGYQISDRAVIDIGYRYMDLGSAESGRVDSAGFVNPEVKIEDITEHQIKIGLRYAFGAGNDCCAQQYAPLK